MGLGFKDLGFRVFVQGVGQKWLMIYHRRLVQIDFRIRFLGAHNLSLRMTLRLSISRFSPW